LRSPFYCRQPLSEGVHDQFLEMDAETLAVDHEPAAFRDTPQQPVLNGGRINTALTVSRTPQKLKKRTAVEVSAVVVNIPNE